MPKYTGTWKKTETYIWLRTDNPNFGVKAPLALDDYSLSALKGQEVVSFTSKADFIKKHNLKKREKTDFAKIEMKW